MHLNNRIMAIFTTLLTLAACGGGDSPAGEGEGEEGESEGEGEGEGEGESEAESECVREDCDDGDSCTTDRWDAERCECAHTSLREDCDDEVECTDDSWNDGSCQCEHQPLHARCFDPETRKGRICDLENGCVAPPPCATEADCPESGTACLRRVCLTATATCDYPLLDSDEDDHAPQICAEFGGDDCDDSRDITYPDAREFCDGQDNDCNGEIDDLAQLGEPCDGWDDSDLCEEGVWECEGGESESEGEYDLVCTDFTGDTREFCNGEDEDCDGEVDENWPQLGDPCDGPDGDFCEEGVWVCNASGTDVRCTDTTGTTSESCNGEDDDCDGEVDENWATACEDEAVACTDSELVECNCCDGIDNDEDDRVDRLDSNCDRELWCTISIVGAPSGRYNHTAVWTGSEMVVWGGAYRQWQQYANNGGRYRPASDTWSDDSLYVWDLAPRNLHTAVWTGSEMVVWGGLQRLWPDAASATNTGGRYDLTRWDLTSTTNVPSARYWHTAVWTGSEMVVWGGLSESGATLTGSAFDPTSNSWDSLSTQLSPSSRWEHTAIWTGSAMIVWGGRSEGGSTATGGRYDPESNSWEPTSTIGAPAARSGHTAVWTGSEMIVWGSSFGDDTGGRYDPGLNAWTDMTTEGVAFWGTDYSTVWTGSEMIVWGGQSGGDSYYDSGSRYDPVSDTWANTTLDNAPSARSGHTAVWTGSEMVVWGGQTCVSDPPWGCRTEVLNSGSRYFPPPTE